MLANQTRAALLTLDLDEKEDDHGIVRILSMTAHLWRAEQMMGVVEVDKQGFIVKAGCCALHQPGWYLSQLAVSFVVIQCIQSSA